MGQGYDGTGKIRCVQARVTREYPNAKFVHCRNHLLNLAICHACKTAMSQKSESVSAVLRNFEPKEETPADLYANHDTKTMSTASSLHKAFLSFDFVIAHCVVGKPLDTLNPLLNSMQDPVCDLVKASEHAVSLRDVLLKKKKGMTPHTLTKSGKKQLP